MSADSIADYELLIRELAKLYKYVGLGTATDFIGRIRSESEFLDVVVIGRVKDGKSMLLNALLVPEEGYELPTDRKPLTSKPWCLSYSSAISETVIGRGKNGEKVGQWTWKDIKSVQNDKELWDVVAEFEADVCSSLLRPLGKVKFWDTPGFDDASKRSDGTRRVDEDLLAKFIMNKEIVFLVCSYETHGHMDDLLKQLCRAQFSHFAAVLNVRGTVNDIERKTREIKEYLSSVLETQNVSVWPLDCKEAFHIQKDLFGFPTALRDALNRFREKSDIAALRSRDWGADLRSIVTKLDATGIVSFRQHVQNLLDSRSALLMIRRAAVLVKTAEEVIRQLTENLKTAESEKADLSRQCKLWLAPLQNHLAPNTKSEIKLSMECFLSEKRPSLERDISVAFRDLFQSTKPGIVWNLFGGRDKKHAQSLQVNAPDRIRKCMDDFAREVVRRFPGDLVNKLSLKLEDSLLQHLRKAEAEGIVLDEEFEFDSSFRIDVTLAPPSFDFVQDKVDDALRTQISPESVHKWLKCLACQSEGSPADDTFKRLVSRVADAILSAWSSSLLSIHPACDEQFCAAFERERAKLEIFATKHFPALLTTQQDIQENDDRISEINKHLKRAKATLEDLRHKNKETSS